MNDTLKDDQEEINGETLTIGRLPFVVRCLGFVNREEVKRIARRWGMIVSPMRMDDVVDWFEEHITQTA